MFLVFRVGRRFAFSQYPLNGASPSYTSIPRYNVTFGAFAFCTAAVNNVNTKNVGVAAQ
jgi:hypothetical protein